MKAKNRKFKGGYKEVVGVQQDIFGMSHYVVVSKGGKKQDTIPFKEAKIREEKK